MSKHFGRGAQQRRTEVGAVRHEKEKDEEKNDEELMEINKYALCVRAFCFILGEM